MLAPSCCNGQHLCPTMRQQKACWLTCTGYRRQRRRCCRSRRRRSSVQQRPLNFEAWCQLRHPAALSRPSLTQQNTSGRNAGRRQQPRILLQQPGWRNCSSCRRRAHSWRLSRLSRACRLDGNVLFVIYGLSCHLDRSGAKHGAVNHLRSAAGWLSAAAVAAAACPCLLLGSLIAPPHVEHPHTVHTTLSEGPM